MAERAIQITTQDFGVQKRVSARPSWSRAAPAGPFTRGTLTGDAVDLVALDGGEVSWQWEDYFRIAAAMQARRASSE